jgi:hypothetical protein
MRATVTRNVKGLNLPPSVNKTEIITFEEIMVKAFEGVWIS